MGASRASRASGTSRAWAAVLLAACLSCTLLVLGGCRDSDALKEVVYDQTADIIDYDNPTKIYINDSTSDVESEDVAAKETSDDASTISATVQNLVVYSSDPNTEGFTAKKSAFANPSDFEGIEASEEVCFVDTDDPDAFKHAPTVEDPDEPEDEPEQPPEQQIAVPDSSAPASQDTPTTTQDSKQSPGRGPGDGSEDENDDGDGDDGDDGDEGKGDEDPGGEDPQPVEEDNNPGGNDKGDVPIAYDSNDPTADPVKVNSVAAYGPAATIVQMIGGKGALAATDAETLAGGFATVFDTSSITGAWAGDGSDASTVNVDALIESGANTVLVYNGNYLKDGLTEADIERLNKAGITQTVIYPMTNSVNIKQDVTVIGQMLSEATEIEHAGQTVARAGDYVAFHDDVVSRAAAANGGLAGSRMYQSGGDGAVPGFASGTPTYTLVIDAFEDSSYSGGAHGGWKPSAGLAFASAGYNSTPLSYYIQAGGLINNAADKTIGDDSGRVTAWQFQTNNFAFNPSQWVGAIAERARAVSGYSLLTTTTNLHGIFPFGESYGSKSFPKVIVTSAAIENSVIRNSKDKNGTLHPYDFESDGVFNIMGPVPSVPSCIGFNGADSGQATNLFESGQVTDDDIVINPTGLFSDWTQGTVESFLEAAWVSDVVNGTGSKLGWQQLVSDFYSEFYGYSLTTANWADMNPEGK